MTLQINIAIDSYNKLNRAVKSKGYLTRGKKKIVILYCQQSITGTRMKLVNIDAIMTEIENHLCCNCL